MNKSLKIAKINTNDMIKPIIIFYCIVVASLILNLALVNSNIHLMTKELELATAIFLFVCGLNSFKENFYFAQGNNISRKSFVKGVIGSIFPIAIVMSIIDIVINRVVNIFTEMPTIYDMICGSYASIDLLNNSTAWVQDNSILVIFNSVLICFILYCLAYVLGLAISMLYFRCNTIMKILVSVIGIMILNLLSFVFDTPIFETQFGNFYIGLLSDIGIFIFLVGIIFLLVKNAEVKGK
ncbi:hypothetical protein H8S20_02360 [Clostridium sp. NSJ-6]|uniref:ABC-2 family transporter protein n=1 Tax=Clostridium hominis TaxID=2763036 RepID=A0ABR7D8S7_9CLOT|nr:hypothetical protein [Clostridium hominis]MBC5627727.1 hypothetical protein [Clostridium hominis]MDU2673015.1 hypothetical protein [Clostridium sp.]